MEGVMMRLIITTTTTTTIIEGEEEEDELVIAFIRHLLYLPGTVLSSLHTISKFILTMTL